MDKPGHNYKIGISVSGKDGWHYRKYKKKGFGIMEFYPETDDEGNIIANLKARKPGCDVAINLRVSPGMDEEELSKSISSTYSLLYDFADIFTIDVTQKNFDYIEDIIDALVDFRLCYDTYKPLLVRLTNGLSEDCIDDMLKICRMSGIDGVIAQNYSTILEKVDRRYPVFAETTYANPRIVSEVFTSGAEAIIVHTYKPKCGFVRKSHKACESAVKPKNE